MESEVCFGHVKFEMPIVLVTGDAVGIQESGFQEVELEIKICRSPAYYRLFKATNKLSAGIETTFSKDLLPFKLTYNLCSRIQTIFFL